MKKGVIEKKKFIFASVSAFPQKAGSSKITPSRQLKCRIAGVNRTLKYALVRALLDFKESADAPFSPPRVLHEPVVDPALGAVADDLHRVEALVAPRHVVVNAASVRVQILVHVERRVDWTAQQLAHDVRDVLCRREVRPDVCVVGRFVHHWLRAVFAHSRALGHVPISGAIRQTSRRCCPVLCQQRPRVPRRIAHPAVERRVLARHKILR